MRHCERSEAIQVCARGKMDCFVARAPRNDGETALFHELHFESGSEELARASVAKDEAEE
jgi:hypothetical protein